MLHSNSCNFILKICALVKSGSCYSRHCVFIYLTTPRCAILSVKLKWAGGESELSQCNIHFPGLVCIRIFSSFSSTQAERAAAGGSLSLELSLELMLLGYCQREDQRHVLSRRQIRHTGEREWGRIKSEMLWGQLYEMDPRWQAESDPNLYRNI